MINTKTDMINEALSWYGTPFGPGAIKGKSCSCTGLLAGIARNMGLERLTKEFSKYEYHVKPEDARMLILKLRDILQLGDPNNIGLLDVIVVKTKHNWHHVGLVLRNNNVIESSEKHKRVIYSRLNYKPSLILKVQEIQNWPD